MYSILYTWYWHIQLSDEMINHDTENVLQDEPCNFISKGTFDTIFQDEHITFDPQKEIYYTIILRSY
jgi:hypothetical protein